jgi:hypothetical protein
MQQHKTVGDHTVDRLYELTARLQDCLTDAEQIRARLTKARDTYPAWPDLEGAIDRVMNKADSREH